jgi:hypothetical protein
MFSIMKRERKKVQSKFTQSFCKMHHFVNVHIFYIAQKRSSLQGGATECTQEIEN